MWPVDAWHPDVNDDYGICWGDPGKTTLLFSYPCYINNSCTEWNSWSWCQQLGKDNSRQFLSSIYIYNMVDERPLYWHIILVGSALDHRSLPPEFESRRGHIWRVFHLWLRFITFGGHSAHLAYHVHKSGRKTLVIFRTDTASIIMCQLWDIYKIKHNCYEILFDVLCR